MASLVCGLRLGSPFNAVASSFLREAFTQEQTLHVPPSSLNEAYRTLRIHCTDKRLARAAISTAAEALGRMTNG